MIWGGEVLGSCWETISTLSSPQAERNNLVQKSCFVWWHLHLCVLLKDLTHYQGNSAVPADLVPHRAPAEGKAQLGQQFLRATAATELVSAAPTHRRGQTDTRTGPWGGETPTLFGVKNFFAPLSLGIAAFEGVGGSEVCSPCPEMLASGQDLPIPKRN